MNSAEEFDLLHFHNDYFHFPFSAKLDKPILTTLHGRLDLPDLQLVYSRFKKQPLISISNHQRKPIPFANWLDTIYHGLPQDLYDLGSGDGDYVAFIGRICREKRPDRAIEIAKRAGIKIRIAAKIDKVDIEYFEKHIKQLLDDPLVEFIGEIGEDLKTEFLGRAKALLFPIDWLEPFGMVMIEAMACGTPVIAYPNGSVPEVIQHGENGYQVTSIEEATKALENVELFNRTHIRKIFEDRFSVRIMTENYLRNYEYLCNSKFSAGLKLRAPSTSRQIS
jgi:glycosyltransferase involved in cell wall biosynthesis